MLTKDQLEQLNSKSTEIKLNDQMTLKSFPTMFFPGMYSATITFHAYYDDSEVKHTFAVNISSMEALDTSVDKAIENYAGAIRQHLRNRYRRSR